MFQEVEYINGTEILFTNKVQKMKNRILEFIKTDHFLLSQWDRKVDDTMLYKILPSVECSKCDKDLVVIVPSFLKRKEIAKSEKHCLILIIKAKLILTAYWCDHPNYLFKREKNAHFQILY